MISILAAVVLAGSGDPIKLAAPGLTMVGIESKMTTFYTGNLAQQLGFQGVQVSTAADLAALLGFERQQQLMGCPDDVCKAGVSQSTGVDGLLVGQVAKLDKEYKIDVRVLSGTGQPLAAASATSETNDRLVSTFSLLAQQLASQLSVKLGRALAPNTADVIYKWSALKKMLWIPLGLGVASTTAGTVGFVKASGAFSDLTRVRDVTAPPGSPNAPLTPDQAAAIAGTGKTAQTLGGVGVGVGVGMLVAAAGLYFFGGDEMISAGLSMSPAGNTVGFTGAW